ncbi:MFS transporter [Leeia oryzae]|uniref:MFS transporter n=1 Tax=Leeia oryzae TaxID=356662 RepID=UPI00036C4B23|nr:MFS transporter [Leeia oryzae]
MLNPLQQRRQFLSLAVYFITYGVVVNSLLARQPALQTRYALDTGEWGWVLFLLGLGGVAAHPISRFLLARWGSRRMCRRCGGLQALWMIVLVLAPTTWLFYISLFISGILNNCVGAAINTQGALLESETGKRQMGFHHAVYYIGSFIAAAASSLFAKFNVPLPIHFLIVGILLWCVYLLVGSKLIQDTHLQQKKAARETPMKVILPVGLVAAFAAITEGAINGWSTLYMNRGLGSTESMAAMGLGIFSLAMMAGRFLGDYNAERLGVYKLIRFGTWLSAAILTAVVLIHRDDVMLIGLVFIGLGHAASFPLIYSIAGRLGAGAIPAIMTFASTGSLLGPLFFGRIATHFSLNVVMLTAAGCFFLMGLIAIFLRKHDQRL